LSDAYIYIKGYLWEEKKYTKLKRSNHMPEANAINDITTSTNNKSTKSQCNDIGKNWERKCPKCKCSIFYSDKYKLKRANNKESACAKCCNKLPPDDTLYFRSCPSCEKRIDYVKKCRYIAGEKNKTNCKSCAMRLAAKLRPPITNTTRQNMSKSQKGRKHSEKTKNEMRGKNNGMFGVYRCGEQNPFYGKTHTEKSKTDMRLAAIKRFSTTKRKNGNLAAIGKNETKYFIELEKNNGWDGIFYGKCESQYHLKTLGYFLDYYEPTKNIVVEYDEPRHYVGGILKQKDVTRMNSIKTHLGCRFFRYNEKIDELIEY